MKGTSGLYCSFCHKPEKRVGKLLASTGDEPRAYICEECVTVCAMILEEDRDAAGEQDSDLHGRLLAAIEKWIRAEALNGIAPAEFNEMHELAREFCSAKR